MKIINMTPHTVNIKDCINIPSHWIIRVAKWFGPAGSIEHDECNIPLLRVKQDLSEWLIPETKDTIYIVSSIVCSILNHRLDLYTPVNFNKQLGHCLGLSQNPYYEKQ